MIIVAVYSIITIFGWYVVNLQRKFIQKLLDENEKDTN
jgi:hypothetical protein